MTTWERENKSKRKKKPQILRLRPHFKMNYSPIAQWRFDGIKNVSRNSFGSFQSKIVESRYEYRKPMNNKANIFFEILTNYILRGMSGTLGLVPWGSLCHPQSGLCSCSKQSVNKQGCLGLLGILFYLDIGKSKIWTRLTNVTCNSMSVATNSSLEQRCVENHSCRIVTPPRLKNGISHIRSGDFHLFSRCSD